MFVTDHLRNQVQSLLDVLTVRQQWLETRVKCERGWADDLTQRWAAERTLHTAVESCVDVANVIIDALIMREPAGYADILRVVQEEGVIPAVWFSRFVGAVDFRMRLLRHYDQVTAAEVEDAVNHYAPLFGPYIDFVQAYLHHPDLLSSPGQG